MENPARTDARSRALRFAFLETLDKSEATEALRLAKFCLGSGETLLCQRIIELFFKSFGAPKADSLAESQIRMATTLAARGFVESGDLHAGIRQIGMVIDWLLEHQSDGLNFELGEALALKARALKDAALADQDEGLLYEASQVYEEAAKWHPDAYYPKINQAALLAWMDFDSSKIITLVRQVRDECLAKLPNATDAASEFWLSSTLGEAWLLEGNLECAAASYQHATALAKSTELIDLRARCSTRRQARRHNELFLNIDRNALDAAFDLPRAIVFAGPLLTERDGTGSNLSAEDLDQLAAKIRAFAQTRNCGVGFGSPGAGPQLTFLETVTSLGGITKVLLPEPEISYRETCVDSLGALWSKRFDAAKQAATTWISSSSHHPAPDSLRSGFAHEVLFGFAKEWCGRLDLDLEGLAVVGESWETWDVRDSIRLWNKMNLPVETIDTPRQQHAVAQNNRETRPLTNQQSVRAILFADVSGFSKLAETQFTKFNDYYLGTISALISSRGLQGLSIPMICNTWGDGLYMVFETVQGAGAFSLALRDRLSPKSWGGEVDWTAYELPAELSIRVALHAGPVYIVTDPITRNLTCAGRNVILAARLEPIVVPGSVFATFQFAALASCQGSHDFFCRFLGELPLDKKHPPESIYRLESLATRGLIPHRKPKESATPEALEHRPLQ